MQVIIDIPEEEYEKCKFFADLIKGDVMIDSLGTALRIRIANGTPLPKNHGRLVDVDTLEDTVFQLNQRNWEITRGEFKLMDGVLWKMPVIIKGEGETEE